MNKNLKPICLGFAAVLMSASLLRAEEAQEMTIGGGITIANDSLKKVTHNSLGLNFNVSTQMRVRCTPGCTQFGDFARAMTNRVYPVARAPGPLINILIVSLRLPYAPASTLGTGEPNAESRRASD